MVVLLFLPETAKLSLEELDTGQSLDEAPSSHFKHDSPSCNLLTCYQHQSSLYLQENKPNGVLNNLNTGISDIFSARMSSLSLSITSVRAAIPRQQVPVVSNLI